MIYAPVGSETASSAAAVLRIETANGVDLRMSVHVDAGGLAERCDLAGFGVAHLVPEADRLVANLEQGAPDLDDIAGQQFALVGDILLDRRHAAAGFAQ